MRHLAPPSRRSFPACLPIAALAALLLAPAPALAASYWVGNGGNPPCTHATLQQAMDAAVGAAGDDVIYLVGAGPFTGPFTEVGGGFEIVGNVASCGATLSVGRSTVNAPSGERPLTLLVLGVETVRLRHLVVTTGQTSHAGDGGAVHFTGGSSASRLELVDTRVVDSVALGIGGGILVSGGRLTVVAGSQVSGNTANAGGGIAAAVGAIVELDGAGVVGNTSFFDGGGIHTQGGAAVIVGSSTEQPTVVANNVAARYGGGLYLLDEAEHRISSAAGAPPAVVSGNQAQRGGGAFIDGSFVRLDYASIDHNQASIEGGALYLAADGTLVANSFDQPEPTRGGYPRIESNAAPQAAVMHVDDGAVVLASGRIRDHHAGNGSDGLVRLLSGILFLHGVALEGNQAPALFSIENATMLQLEHVSLAGNTVGGFVRWRGSSSEVILTSSALDETEPLFASFQSPSTPPQIACVTSRFASPFAVVPSGTDLTWVTIADPQFAAPPEELHLRHTSPAIDSCPPSERPDVDGEIRSYDDRYHPGPEELTADAGVDEATVLFVDGFENGDAGAWNDSDP